MQVEVFWVMTSYGDAVGFRRFGGLYCLHIPTRRHNPEDDNLNLHRRENLKYRVKH